jgi:ribose/xylose/arabinose/galactoside ABC-type transport system permease subunit
VILAIATLLHILIFVYWLGGDLGVFYSSTILTDTNASPKGRIAAARILAQVDMAPRTAMILTLPTGLTLASLSGYVNLSVVSIAAVWLLAMAWLTLAWIIHLKHLPPGSFWRQTDLGVRVILTLGLVGVAVSGLVPLFVSLKLVIFATTIVMGLLIRRALAPFGPAFGDMIADGPSTETDKIIAKSLNQSRPAVLCIWVLLLTAALLGIAKPS